MKSSKERPNVFSEVQTRRKHSKTPKKKHSSNLPKKSDSSRQLIENVNDSKNTVPPSTESRKLNSKRKLGGHTRSLSPKCGGRPENHLNKIETIIESEYKTLNRLLIEYFVLLWDV